MTSTSGRPAPDEEDRSPADGSSRPKEAPGVELGMSEGPGGTFEPEEDAEDGEGDAPGSRET